MPVGHSVDLTPSFLGMRQEWFGGTLPTPCAWFLRVAADSTRYVKLLSITIECIHVIGLLYVMCPQKHGRMLLASGEHQEDAYHLF